MWFDIITPTDFGGTPEHLKSENFIRNSMNLTKIENALRGHTRRWADQKNKTGFWTQLVQNSDRYYNQFSSREQILAKDLSKLQSRDENWL